LWGLYARVYDQKLETGGLNVLSVYATMDRMGIDKADQLELLGEVRMLDMKVREEFKR